MKFRIEISGRGGEVLVGKVKREFYDIIEDNAIDIEEYAWNEDFFEENTGVLIPEDIRPFDPGEWYNCTSMIHECGPDVESSFITVSQGNDILFDNVEYTALLSAGARSDCVDEFYPEQMLEDGDVYFVGQSFEKGFFYSFELEADTFDLTKLVLQTINIDGWELIVDARYAEAELEDLGELFTDSNGSCFSINLVEKD